VEGCIEGDKFMTVLFREPRQESVRDKLYSEGIVGELSDWKYHQRNEKGTSLISSNAPTHCIQNCSCLPSADHFVSPQMIETIGDTALD
jgi:hypothetical protein